MNPQLIVLHVPAAYSVTFDWSDTMTDNEPHYTGEERPDSPELIAKIRSLSPSAQSVLYALLLEEGEDEPATREGVNITDVQEACSSCSLDEADVEQAIQAGIVELETRGYVEERDGRLYLKTRAEHMRTFERVVESSAYVVRR